jgi:acyl dehydratase
MATRKLYFEAVRVGEEMPALTKPPVDRVQLARYAGASGDFNPVHVDETYAKGLGMPSVYAPGMLIMGFLGQLVSDWGRGAQLRRYSVKFSKIVWPGDTVVCKGRVTERWGDEGRYFAELDLWAENQKGELVLRGGAQLQLFHSLEDENRQRSGQPPLVIPAPRESILPPAPPSPAPRKEPAVAAPVTGVKKATPRESPALRKAPVATKKASKK